MQYTSVAVLSDTDSVYHAIVRRIHLFHHSILSLGYLCDRYTLYYKIIKCIFFLFLWNYGSKDTHQNCRLSQVISFFWVLTIYFWHVCVFAMFFLFLEIRKIFCSNHFFILTKNWPDLNVNHFDLESGIYHCGSRFKLMNVIFYFQYTANIWNIMYTHIIHEFVRMSSRQYVFKSYE